MSATTATRSTASCIARAIRPASCRCAQRAAPSAEPSSGYGVDHVKVVEGLGCKAIRVHSPAELAPAIQRAEELMAQFSVPVVIEVILERVTNTAMGTEIDNVQK